MKTLKFIFVLLLTVSITSCSSSEDNTPAFTLSNANLAGTYTIKSLTAVEIESATSSAGVTSQLSKNNKIGDTFQVDLIINSTGTYSFTGPYKSVSTVTPTPALGQPDAEIITLKSTGTYKLNTTLNTIEFTQDTGDFIDGSFDISTFNENTLTVNQVDTDTNGGITNEITTAITFIKK